MSRERPASAQRPYLLRAMHEWMTDNALTPHIVVDAGPGTVDVPAEDIRDNRIVLYVSYAATRGLVIGNDSVSFEARFNGVSRQLEIPISAVVGIYARESGQGMVFSDEEAAGHQPPNPPPDTKPPAGNPSEKRPNLKLIK